nr:MAG TPA: hypothetical protein [Caudoviricetes sp.]
MALKDEELKNTSLAQAGAAAGSGGYFTPADRLKDYAGGYKPSDTVTKAKDYLQTIIEKKPGEFNSYYDSQIKTLYDRLQSRPDFRYDVNQDALYQQYKNQYQLLGQQAMQDTVGNAAALTGGYGNSWAATAGSQAYQGYLQKLNDIIPDLYNQAYSRYNQEGDNLRSDIALANSLKESDYGMYRDQVSDWQADRNFAQNAYDNAYSRDYGQWGDMLNYWKMMHDLGITFGTPTGGGEYTGGYSGGGSSGSGRSSGSGSSSGGTNYSKSLSGSGSTGIPWQQLGKSSGMGDLESRLFAENVSSNLNPAQQQELANTFKYKAAAEAGTPFSPEWVAMNQWKKNGGASNAASGAARGAAGSVGTKKNTLTSPWSSTTDKKKKKSNALSSILAE